MAEIVKLYSENPSQKEIDQVVKCLKKGGVIIYPTDTVYGMGCDLTNAKAVEKLALIKGERASKANFSIVCYDLSHISDYAKQVDTPTFKLMKRCLPGPYTFILEANNRIPKMFNGKKKEVGIRVPDNNIVREIVKSLGRPLVNTSIRDNDEIVEYTTDPELIYENHFGTVDLVVNGGFGKNEASTIIDCTGDEPVVVREGLGDISFID